MALKCPCPNLHNLYLILPGKKDSSRYVSVKHQEIERLCWAIPGWTLFNYSKKKWECQCETDDQSRGEKVKKRRKKDLKMEEGKRSKE